MATDYTGTTPQSDDTKHVNLSGSARFIQRQQVLRNQSYNKRFKMIAWGFLIVIVCILAKLFYIQLVDASNLKSKALHSRKKVFTLYHRGRILDRTGKVLAEDSVLYDLYAHPAHYQGLKAKELAEALAPIIGEDEQELEQKLLEPYSTISLKKNLSKALIEKITAARIAVIAKDKKTNKLILDENGRPKTTQVPLNGLDFPKKSVRNYPEGTLAAHVLGYVNDEANISSGVESMGKKTLKKRPSSLDPIFLDGRGHLMGLVGRDPKKILSTPKAKDIYLTLDAHLQYIAERELAAGLERAKAERGTVLMMNPKTGSILAFAVSPTYQPDQFYKVTPSTLKNWAISDVYPPGSTFKILTLASALENGVIDEETQINDTGKMTLGGWSITNYDYARRGAPGMINLVDLLVHSSNVASAKIALKIPREKHFSFLKMLGIGSKTNIDLPGESPGIIKSLDTWDESTHGSIGYGYGIATTPLQMASAVAAIANNGVWNTPHVMQGSPVEHRRVMSRETSHIMQRLLADSIAQPTTSTVQLDNVTLAGKTGTSRKPKDSGRGYTSDIYTSFVGFFPAQSPEILVMVVVDSPHMAESWGSTVAGPIFKNIAEEVLISSKTAKTQRTSKDSTSAKTRKKNWLSFLPAHSKKEDALLPHLFSF